MYTIICEGKKKCTDYEKCVQEYNKTGKDKCIKKTQYKSYSCDNGGCTRCNHLKNCTLILPNTKGYQKTINEINDTIHKINETEENIQYLLRKGENPDKERIEKEEQIENLRKQRKILEKKEKILRKKAYRRIFS